MYGQILILSLLTTAGAFVAPPMPGAYARGFPRSARRLQSPSLAPRMQGMDELSPLHIVSGQGNVEAAVYLLERGHPVDPKISTGHTPLHIACQEGSTEVACLLVDEAGAEIDARTVAGITPLYLAVQKGKLSTALALIERGASVDAATETGHSALHVAAHFGSLEAAVLLIEKGGAVDAQTGIGHTPLHLAALHNQPAMTKLLLQRGGAAVDIEDNTGRSPLHLAAQNCAAEVVEALLAAGASVDRESSRGLTALECAIYGATSSSPQFHTTVEVLLARGAAVSKTHKWNGQTALHAAAYLGRQECVEMLVARGAAKDEAFYLQTGDGLINQVRSMEMAYEAQAAAYRAAIRQAPNFVEAHLRLGSAQARMDASQGGGSSQRLAGGAEAYREAWKCASQLDGLREPEYVKYHREMAVVGMGRAAAAATLADLSVDIKSPGCMQRAVALWRQQGVVVWPSLLNESTVGAVLERVRGALDDNTSVDRSANIREPVHRRLRAVAVEDMPEALAAIAKELAPFLDEALMDRRQLVLEHAAYRISPGAAEQEWHRDDATIDSRIASVQVSLVDTVAVQGALEVAPASHGADRPCPPPTTCVSMAVPAGSVVFYSPNLLHRGRANQHVLERLILTFSVVGKHGLVPNGIPLAVQPQDQGKWWLHAGRLQQANEEVVM